MSLKPARRATRASGKSRGRPFFIAPRDKHILKYIWHWKIASSASIHEAIGRPASPYSTYKVLSKLEDHNLIECRFDLWDQFHVWQLTEVGFAEVKDHVGELKEDGFLSENHRHDRMVQAFQLGEWSTNQCPKVTFFTEQQLRRMDVNHYPDWVPRTTLNAVKKVPGLPLNAAVLDSRRNPDFLHQRRKHLWRRITRRLRGLLLLNHRLPNLESLAGPFWSLQTAWAS